MPITAVYATKGGQGVTTTAAALAILTARTGARTLLVDTAHDQPAILGLPDPTGPGLGDYLQPASRTTLAQITTPSPRTSTSSTETTPSSCLLRTPTDS